MTKEEFEKKVHILKPRLMSYALSMLKDREEAEDMVQEVFLKLWFLKERISLYRSFEGVTFTILRRLIINHKSRSKKNIVSLQESLETIDPDFFKDFELSDELLTALEGLPTMEQAVMRMKHLEDMETEEIALLIDSNPNAVRVALSRARKKLRERFIRGK